jgi:hypothetical protein
MTKAALCGLTIFHRLTTFGFKKLLKSGQTMKNRQTTVPLDCQKSVKQGIAVV